MKTLKSFVLSSPLGQIIVMADEKFLYFLEFKESKGFERRFERFIKKLKATIDAGSNAVIHSIEQELKQYFEGKLHSFTTPIMTIGTPFQKQVWEKLRQTKWGETLSYAGLAAAVGNPLGCRAVANANGANHLGIIIPCHRIIQSNGQLGGYGGGIDRKRWLLDLEGATYRLN